MNQLNRIFLASAGASALRYLAVPAYIKHRTSDPQIAAALEKDLATPSLIVGAVLGWIAGAYI